ncbi:anti-sigma factor ChrR (cupin superfamily) [Pantoea sp. SORGH_AS 659]|jgi:anti-sigma factor ChrR (cupin superfamily)|nr:anti-sigma factor ChrR (cupin superfamily) [Pantoea sp. SORGH_AS_0659]
MLISKGIKEKVMSDEKAENMDDIHAVIGHAVSCLLKSDQPLQLDHITALLKQHEEAAPVQLKQDYVNAMSKIAEKCLAS